MATLQYSLLDLQDVYKQTVSRFLGELDYVSPGYSLQELVDTRTICFIYIQKLLQVYTKCLGSIPGLDLNSHNELPHDVRSPLIDMLDSNNLHLRAPPSSGEAIKVPPRRQQTNWKKVLKKNLARFKSHSKSPYRVKPVKIASTIHEIPDSEFEQDLEKHLPRLWDFVTQVNEKFFPEWQIEKDAHEYAAPMKIQAKIMKLEGILKAFTMTYAKVTCLNDVHSFDCLQLPGTYCSIADKPSNTPNSTQRLRRANSTLTSSTERTKKSVANEPVVDAAVQLNEEHSTQEPIQERSISNTSITGSMDSWLPSDPESNNASLANIPNSVFVKLVGAGPGGRSSVKPEPASQTCPDCLDLHEVDPSSEAHSNSTFLLESDSTPDLPSDLESAVSWKSVTEGTDSTVDKNSHNKEDQAQAAAPPIVSIEPSVSSSPTNKKEPKVASFPDTILEATPYTLDGVDETTHYGDRVSFSGGDDMQTDNEVIPIEQALILDARKETRPTFRVEKEEHIEHKHDSETPSNGIAQQNSGEEKLDLSEILKEEEQKASDIFSVTPGTDLHNTDKRTDKMAHNGHLEGLVLDRCSGFPEKVAASNDYSNYLSFSELQILKKSK